MRRTPQFLRKATAAPPQKIPHLTLSSKAPSGNSLSQLQQSIGNHAINGIIRAKLKVTQPGDKHKQQADRVADTVMRMPEPLVQRQPQEEEEKTLRRQPKEEEDEMMRRQPLEEDEELQTKPNGSNVPQVSPRVQSQINSLRGGGRPLPTTARTFYEPRFGYDFSDVHVHTNSRAAETAAAVNAKAFTVGRDVVFGPGEYAPESAAGKRLLAHELTHVVQQSSSSLSIQRDDGVASGAAENASRVETNPNPVRLQRLNDLMQQITEQTLDTLLVRGQLDALPPASSLERVTLEEALNASRTTLIQLLEERISLLYEEIANLEARSGPSPTSSAEHPEIEALGHERNRRADELRQHQQQLRPLKRWQTRREIETLETQIAEADKELSALPQVSDPTDPRAELAQLRRNELEQRKKDLAASLTSTATEYEQWDSRWGAIRYGQSTACTNIKEAGCGPTSLAMLLNYLYQEDPESLAASGAMEIVTPPETAAYAATHGRVCNSGTVGDTMVTQVHTGFPGFQGKKVSLDEATAQLRRGNLIIFLCKSCTGKKQSGGARSYGGHFMVLNGVDANASVYNVLDPGAKEASDIATISRAELLSNSGGFWMITRM